MSFRTRIYHCNINSQVSDNGIVILIVKQPRENYECVPLEWSRSGSMIQDHSDHGASKEPRNPLWARIPRFLWCTMIQVILDHWSWSGSSQRNALYETWSEQAERGVTSLTNVAFKNNTMCNLKFSRKIGIFSRFFFGDILVKCQTSLFFSCNIPELSYFPEKFPSHPIPSKISRFREEFCLSPETGGRVGREGGGGGGLG